MPSKLWWLCCLVGFSSVVRGDDTPVKIDPARIQQEDALVAEMRKWTDRPWLHSERSVVAFPTGDATHFEFSPDSKKIATLGRELRVLDLTTGRVILEVNVGEHHGFGVHGNDILQWSRDGEWLAMPGKEKVVVRSSAKGEVIKELPVVGVVRRVFFSQDGKRLIAVSHHFEQGTRTARQWRTSDWSPAGEDIVMKGFGPASVISRDGNLLVHQPDNKNFGKPPHPDVIVYDLTGGKPKTLKSEVTWRYLQISPDSKTLVGETPVNNMGDTAMRLLDLESGKTRQLLVYNRYSVSPNFSVDGKTIAFDEHLESSSAVVTRWLDVETGKELWSQFGVREQDCLSSPAGRILATTRVGFHAGIHIFAFPERISGRWKDDGEAINKARAAGVQVELHPTRIRFEYTSLDRNLKERFEAANAAYPKATSVRLARPIGSGGGDYRPFLAVLKNYKELDELIIDGAHLTDDCFKDISELKNLKRLHVETAITLTSAGLAHLKALPKLESLTLRNCFALKGGVWAALAPLTSLTHLDIRYQFNGTPDGAEQIAELKKLRVLKLTGNETLNGSIFKHFKGLTELESLDLDGFPFKDADLEHIVALKSLKSLRLDYRHIPLTENEYTNAGVAKLKQLDKLHTLHLSNGYRLHLKALEGTNWKQITSLHIGGFELHGDDLKFIANAKELQYLGLPSFPNNDRYAFDGLKSFEKLECVQLPYSLLQPDRIKELKAQKPLIYYVP